MTCEMLVKEIQSRPAPALELRYKGRIKRSGNNLRRPNSTLYQP